MLNSDSLAPLCLLPPLMDNAWRRLAPPPTSHSITRHDNSLIELPLPLFWFDPPWHRLAIETADALAACVAQNGITVSALSRDLAAPGSDSAFLNAASHPMSTRMLPYRPERYGLLADDFDRCVIIDLRLAVGRDDSGAHVFSKSQIQRWEATTDAAPVAGGSWVPAMSFPPDVVSLEALGQKIIQLRKLSPSSAIFASLAPFRAAAEIRRLLQGQGDPEQLPDGIIVRLDQADFTPLQLAQQTGLLRKVIDNACPRKLQLWVVPGSITPGDAAKLVALGADAVAVDHWCDDLVQELANPSEATAASFGYSSRGIVITSESARKLLDGWVTDTLAPSVTRFLGLCRSIDPDPEHRLGSFDPMWADTLRIQRLG